MRILIASVLLALLLFPLTANAVEGDVWGTWSGPDTVYVTGEIRVPPGSTLVIEPGVMVNFQGHYKFRVESSATLIAVGTPDDSIAFTAADTTAGWHGIRFSSANDSSEISYCRIEHGKATGSGDDANGGAIFCLTSRPTISNNTITRNSAGSDGGGIYCDGSRPTISNNIISANSAGTHGGGIYCFYYSSPTISNNIISADSAGSCGGGICCDYNCNPAISNNIISANSAGMHGGGIMCYSPSPTISNNTISGNSANRGGGICCDYSCNPAITNNTISGNSANFWGGGIYCDGSSPTISNNTISGNSTQRGGGIYCDFSSPTMSNNTISGNSANNKGGGIYCYYSDPDVMNTILWLDSAPNGPEIYLTGSSSPEVTYSDVQGGWSGEGNIDCDPEFVNPDSGNFHLQMTSCCIDSGDADPQYNDPDGTRADIGAFYFRQVPPNNIQLMPHSNCIILPPEGGSISYDAGIYNLGDTAIVVDVWAYAFVPGYGQYGPLHYHDNLRVRPGRSIGKNNLGKSVPAMAPAGEYSYVAYIGDFGGEVIDSSYFTFMKLGTPGGKDLVWLAGGGWFEGEEFLFERETVLPTDYALRQNYPNPFNAKTTINYQLPVGNDVKLEVYNLLGQKVAALVNEEQEAGYRSVIWDASQVTSGLYFYKLAVGDYTETQMMMLVK